MANSSLMLGMGLVVIDGFLVVVNECVMFDPPCPPWMACPGVLFYCGFCALFFLTSFCLVCVLHSMRDEYGP